MMTATKSLCSGAGLVLPKRFEPIRRALTPRGNSRLAREVAMNSPLLGVLIVIVLVVGSTLSIMNKACKSGYHAWCAPISTVGHHVKKTRPPA
jgi:hypothetical protein